MAGLVMGFPPAREGRPTRLRNDLIRTFLKLCHPALAFSLSDCYFETDMIFP